MQCTWMPPSGLIKLPLRSLGADYAEYGAFDLYRTNNVLLAVVPKQRNAIASMAFLKNTFIFLFTLVLA